MGEADGVTSAEPSSNTRSEICLEDKATLFVEFLAVLGHRVKEGMNGHVI